jgi:glycosyltransferase involved in cell wall biosynthesis
MSPRICMVTGSPDAGRCGIHDFVLRLAEALRRHGARADILDQRDWSAGGTLGLVAALRRDGADLVHMQYPMIVGWRSLGPHLTGFLAGRPQVVTLHEFSSFDRLRRAFLRAFAWSAARLVLTSAFEAEEFARQFPGTRAKRAIIPIGSNIPVQTRRRRDDGARTIVYFGQIKPLKGLEQFLALAAASAAQHKAWRFQILGAPATWAGGYLAKLQHANRTAQVEWLLDRSDEDAARVLAEAHAAYLPFPDGASERRGSLIAALAHRLPVLTTDGRFVPPDMRGKVLFADGVTEASAALERLFADRVLEERLGQAGRAYAARFSWDAIATAYLSVYDEVLSRRAPNRVVYRRAN